MKVIGLTGGIGSGKSTIAGFLSESGVPVIDTDLVTHDILKTDSDIRQRILVTFGKEILNRDGSIDRQALGKKVFSEAQQKEKLEEILHPAILSYVMERLGEFRERGFAAVVLEVPLLIEAGWAGYVDEVWVASAPRKTILCRMNAKGVPAGDTVARMEAQLPSGERNRHADVIIDTDCSLSDLKAEIKGLWQEFLSRMSSAPSC